MLTALHFVDKFSKEQQIFGLELFRSYIFNNLSSCLSFSEISTNTQTHSNCPYLRIAIEIIFCMKQTLIVPRYNFREPKIRKGPSTNHVVLKLRFFDPPPPT